MSSSLFSSLSSTGRDWLLDVVGMRLCLNIRGNRFYPAMPVSDWPIL